ncbi:MAG: InlB B-repeat-containing protein [Lachnospiraceae bacterium]
MKKKIGITVVLLILFLGGMTKTVFGRTIYEKADLQKGEHIVKSKTVICKHEQKEATAWIEARPMGKVTQEMLRSDPKKFLSTCCSFSKEQKDFHVDFRIADDTVIGNTYGKIISPKRVTASIDQREDSQWDIAYPSTKTHENNEIVANYAYIRYQFVWCKKSKKWECLRSEHTYLYDAKMDRDVEHEVHPKEGHDLMVFETAPNAYRICYEPNGADGKVVYQDAVYGKKVTIQKSLFKRKNYRFVGWTKQANGSGKCYSPGQKALNLTEENGKTIHLYAKWERIYTVKYHLNADGRKGKVPEEQKKAGKEAIQLKLQAPTLSNPVFQKAYRFLGWSETADGSSGLWKDSVYRRESDLALYAQWDTSYQVQYNGNGAKEGNPCADPVGSIRESYVTRKNSSDTKFKHSETYLDTKKVTACKFLGWSLKKEQSQALDKTYFVKEGKTCKNGELFIQALKADQVVAEGEQRNVILYAIWDQAPQMEASDRYFTLEEAQKGAITEEELRKSVKASDKEDGVFEGEKIELPDYQARDFTALQHDAVISVTFRVTDHVGNTAETRKQVRIVDQRPDTTGEKARETLQKIRFLPDTYLKEDAKQWFLDRSLWNCDANYQSALKNAMENQRIEQELIPGSQNVRPGSGRWKKEPQQVWKLSEEEIDKRKKAIK